MTVAIHDDHPLPKLGVPYPEFQTPSLVVCPGCGLEIRLWDRKDDESFSTARYATHYEAAAAAEGNVRPT